jgi:hypothetical protein
MQRRAVLRRAPAALAVRSILRAGMVPRADARIGGAMTSEAEEEVKPLDVSHLPMGDPHPCEMVKAGWCPVCGGRDGEHKTGCEDGSEVL